MNDSINHPYHYTQGKIECIEAIQAALTPDEFVGYLKGQILKYTWRSGHKDDICQDTSKGIWYAQRLIKFVEEQECSLVCVDTCEETFIPDWFMIRYSGNHKGFWEVWGGKENDPEPIAFFGAHMTYAEARSSIPLDKYRPM